MSAAEPQDVPGGESAHQRLKLLFGEVCDLATRAEAEARLQALGATADEREQILALLSHDDGHTTHLSGTVRQMVASVAGGELKPGDRLGAWTLVRELGEGGMGRVFEAQRSDGLYEQRTAIKVLRGFAGEAALAQLAHERQVLASLNHPHIARLLDGGTTPAGNPYLVMEHVSGLRIDEHLRLKGLGRDDALALFQMVCDAVAYAHRRLIVHCDIKPGNVLVDDQGRAKLLDFGIAQLQGRSGSELQALTPRYASPEQRAGAPASASTDIFSLGRTLEVLLAQVRASPKGLPRARELMAIVDMASAADPAQRYTEVSELVADLERFRRHKPLVALRRLRPQAPYVLRKFVRRHWPWLGASVAAVTLAVGFTVGLAQQRDRALQAEAAARAAEAQARRDAQLAGQVGELLVSLFDGADPRSGGAGALRADELLERGRARIAQARDLQPEVRASMTGVLARVYDNMGSAIASIELLREAVRQEQALPQVRVKEMGALLDRLAEALSGMNLNDEAIVAGRDSLAFQQRHAPAGSLELARAHSTLGWVLEVSSEHWDEAEHHHQEALRIRRDRLGPENLAVASSLNKLGTLAYYREQFAVAEPYLQQALALKLKLFGPGRPEVLNTQLDLARTLDRLDRRDEAVRMALEVLEHRLRIYGGKGREVTVAMNAASSILRRAGRAAEAAEWAAKSIALDAQNNVPQSRAFGITFRGRALADLGDPAAERFLREALAMRQQVLPAQDIALARSQLFLGRWLLFNGRLAPASAALEAAWTQLRVQLPVAAHERVDNALLLAEAAVARRDLRAARTWLDEAQRPSATPALQLNGEAQVMSRRVSAQLARAQGDAATALALDREALALAERHLPARHADLLRVRLDVAQALTAAGLAEQASTVLANAEAALREQHPASPLRARAAALRARP